MIVGRAITEEQKKAAYVMSENLKSTKLSRDQIIELIALEYIYWRDTDLQLNEVVFAIGPLANLTAYIALNHSVDKHSLI
jgi:hypothetical protein